MECLHGGCCKSGSWSWFDQRTSWPIRRQASLAVVGARKATACLRRLASIQVRELPGHGLNFLADGLRHLGNRLSRPVFPSDFAIDGMVRIDQLGASLWEVVRDWRGLWILAVIYFALAVTSAFFVKRREAHG